MFLTTCWWQAMFFCEKVFLHNFLSQKFLVVCQFANGTNDPLFLPTSQLPWTLVPPTLDPLLTANTMELELRALLTQHRSVGHTHIHTHTNKHAPAHTHTHTGSRSEYTVGRCSLLPPLSCSGQL